MTDHQKKLNIYFTHLELFTKVKYEIISYLVGLSMVFIFCCGWICSNQVIYAHILTFICVFIMGKWLYNIFELYPEYERLKKKKEELKFELYQNYKSDN